MWSHTKDQASYKNFPSHEGHPSGEDCVVKHVGRWGNIWYDTDCGASQAHGGADIGALCEAESVAACSRDQDCASGRCGTDGRCCLDTVFPHGCYPTCPCEPSIEGRKYGKANNVNIEDFFLES